MMKEEIIAVTAKSKRQSKRVEKSENVKISILYY